MSLPPRHWGHRRHVGWWSLTLTRTAVTAAHWIWLVYNRTNAVTPDCHADVTAAAADGFCPFARYTALRVSYHIVSQYFIRYRITSIISLTSHILPHYFYAMCYKCKSFINSFIFPSLLVSRHLQQLPFIGLTLWNLPGSNLVWGKEKVASFPSLHHWSDWLPAVWHMTACTGTGTGV